MRHTQSLKKNHAYRRVYRQGQSIANRLLVLYVLPNGGSINRLGLTVGKKVGCAVVRNRIKRWLREQYRLAEADIPAGYDLVFVARAAAGALVKPEAFMAIGNAMQHLLKKQLNKQQKKQITHQLGQQQMKQQDQQQETQP